ncbi:MAG: hypothetical protein ACTHK4_15160 [Mycobacteriales bacterium]
MALPHSVLVSVTVFVPSLQCWLAGLVCRFALSFAPPDVFLFA